MPRLPTLLLTLAILPAAACGPTTPVVTVKPTFTDIEQQVFLQSCATSSCHSPTGRAGNMDLTAPNAYANLVGVAPFDEAANEEGKKRVDPGHPENSFLLMKIGTAPLDPKYGTPMPQVGDPVSAQARQAIETWIANGARND